MHVSFTREPFATLQCCVECCFFPVKINGTACKFYVKFVHFSFKMDGTVHRIYVEHFFFPLKLEGTVYSTLFNVLASL